MSPDSIAGEARVPVFVVTGQLAAGKSTVSRALLARYPRGVHIDVDGIREMVVSGLASPLEWTEETSRQFALAIDGSAALSAVYHRAGFAVAIDGALDPAAVARALADVGVAESVVGVVLHPPVDVALQRNRDRATKAFDTRVLDALIRRIDADLAAEPLPVGWHRLDNGAQSLEETVAAILHLAIARASGARASHDRARGSEAG
jgi:predicted kinase